MDNTSNGPRVPSPASTGGAGTFFEQHVDAYWLAQLLVRGIPPIIHDCGVMEVHLQTEHLGWHTDDFLIIGQSSSGNQRKLAGQVKRTFTVSATNDECKKAVLDFWKDFKSDHFSPDLDRFALVTLRGTNTLLEHFSGLLDCSRAARDGVEFEHRLKTPGFINAKAVHYCDELRAIIGEVDGRNVTHVEIWPFLRLLYILSLDLNTATRQHEASIKSLLALTTTELDPIGAATASWNSLLTLLSGAIAEARSFRRDDLPAPLRQRHSPIGGSEQAILQALSHHTEPILRGICSTIGSDVHLERAGFVQQLIERLESTQVVLVSGSSGSGKSVIAKDAITLLSADHFVFGFRAEEFAEPHLDATLQSAQIPGNAKKLGAILAAQDRKILLVESVERLLEHSTRDAFTDLLTLAVADKTWRIVLTCRDYSADLVRSSFLARLEHATIPLPNLDDDELTAVEAAHPTLARPLSNPALRRILCNPYFLDKALQISWSADRPLPESERELRALFWQQIIRADQRVGGGMPSRREEVFEEIALRRARALTMYVRCNDLDPEAVDGLQHDSLVVSSEDAAVLTAPAHDVLEDWAILHWIEKQHVTGDGSFCELFTAIGTYPAMRRGYRKWAGELVERDPHAADKLFQDAVVETTVPPQFRDDTLVSLLRATSSPALLERQSVRLLENNQYLLRRVIHLLRVACVTAATWLSISAEHGSLLNVPDGLAWASVLGLVQTHIGEFTAQDHLLLLGLIEDWGRGVTLLTPCPDGAESAAAIAHWLLPRFDNYLSEKPCKRTLQVIAKIPKADPTRFEALLRGIHEDDRRDRISDEFRKMIFAEMQGAPAARDLPDVFVSGATDYLLCSEADLRRAPCYGSSLDLESLFGINEHLSGDYFPASAYRGPFLPLLRYHPNKGLDFMTMVFNHSADWYAHPRVAESVEPPFEIELTFTDGTSRKQWGNARLWNWYRGTSVGPHALQSLLMALERWLLEIAEARPQKLDVVLLHILQRSESVALTAVVASVATAFPHASGETLLILLRCPMCILLDRQRMVAESQAPSRLLGLIGHVRPENRIYEGERKDADGKPHRSSDLEAAIANLQLGPFAARVHEVLDQNRSTLPPISEQKEDDRIWRLAMHRMDLRQYTAMEEAKEAGLTTDTDAASGESAKHYVRFVLKQPEPDVKEMVDENAARFHTMNARLGLVNWGLGIFKRQESPTQNPADWQQKLLQARNSDATDTDEESLGARNGPGIVAAVCVRDHWLEMSDEERDWCVGIICSEVMRRADVWDYRARMQRFEMSADRPCASVLPLLLGKSLPKSQQVCVRESFVTGLTHAVNEVRWYVALGVAWHLGSFDHDLALRSVNALAAEATLVDDARRREEGLPYQKRRQIDDLGHEAASVIRQRFWQTGAIASDAYQKLDISEWFGAEANKGILAILGQAPTEPAAIAGFTRTAQTLVAWWDADDAQDESRHQRNNETQTALSQLLQDFLMRTSQEAAKLTLLPILDAIDRHPREVHWLFQGLITVEDNEPNTSQFWFLWRSFAAKIRCAKWLADVDDEYSAGGEMVSAIFLGPWWKENVRHWKSLEGYAGHIDTLCEELPPSSTVLHDYVRFLYHIGEQSLPQAFVRVAKYLQHGDPQEMLKKTDTTFMLEVLLQRFVYGRPLELKREHAIGDAIIFLLDSLVESGSSAAFRMRDDFVTPVSITRPSS